MSHLRGTRWAVTVSATFILFASAFEAPAGDQVAAAKAHARNFAFKTDEGRSVVPLPPKAWRKMLEDVTHEEMDMGAATESWKKIILFLVQTGADGVSGLIEVSANESVLEVKDRPPDDFCYDRQLKWEYHKQISAITRDTLCWGVRTVAFPIRTESEAWPKLVEKLKKAGTPLPLDTVATQVRFFKSVSGKFLRIDYYFLAPKGGKPWHWSKARTWAKGLLSRFIAGFDGKSVGGTQ